MAVALKKSDSTLITSRLAEIIPGYKTNKVTKQLLSGAFHTQIIGTGARIVSVETFVDAAGRNTINLLESTGGTVRLEDGQTYYIGTIESAPKWRRITRGNYSATIMLLVSEEGPIS